MMKKKSRKSSESSESRFRLLKFHHLPHYHLRRLTSYHFSLINLAGLAVGLACCILILLWVQDELNYDRFHKNTDQLFRVIRQEKDAAGDTDSSNPA